MFVLEWYQNTADGLSSINGRNAYDLMWFFDWLLIKFWEVMVEGACQTRLPIDHLAISVAYTDRMFQLAPYIINW